MDEFEFAWKVARGYEQGQLQENFDPVLLAKAIWLSSQGKIATYTQSSLGRSRLIVAIDGGRLIALAVGDSVMDDMEVFISKAIKVLDGGKTCPAIRYEYEQGRYIKRKGSWI
jgi:hypothetical protein